MKKLSTYLFALITASTLALCTNSVTAESLGDKISAVGMDWMIGKWGDQSTQGETVSMSYEWRLDKHAISTTLKTAEIAGEGLIALNPENGQVSQVTVDNKGGGSIGEWDEDDGKAVLRFTHMNVEGEKKQGVAVFEKVDNDTVEMSLYEGEDISGDPKITLTLVRLK